MRIINTQLLAHPLNWLVIWTMVFALFLLLHLLGQYIGTQVSDRGPQLA